MTRVRYAYGWGNVYGMNGSLFTKKSLSFLESLIQQPQSTSPQLGVREYDVLPNSRNGVMMRSITKICALSKGNHPETSQ